MLSTSREVPCHNVNLAYRRSPGDVCIDAMNLPAPSSVCGGVGDRLWKPEPVAPQRYPAKLDCSKVLWLLTAMTSRTADTPGGGVQPGWACLPR
jgi:hypothetical protein